MNCIPLAILLHLILLGDASGRRSLSVVISAGQPLESVTGIREVAVIIHGLTDAEKKDGKLYIYSDQRRERRLLKTPLRRLKSEESMGSIMVFTRLYFRPTSWRNGSYPTGNVSYFSEVRHQKRLVVEGCLRVQPRWMGELYPQIRGLPLLNMSIPSTHHSGTYRLYSGRDIGDPFRDCQEEDVFTQLLYGIRALDLRVIAVNNTSPPTAGFEYFINHERLPTENNLREILEDVRDFLQLFPSEVVFIDLHEWPHDRGSGLAALVYQILGPLLYNGTRSELISATLEDVIQGRGRAIVTVNQDGSSPEIQRSLHRLECCGHPIYPGIRHIRGNTDNLDELKRSITAGQIQYKKEHWFYNSMAQITPQGSDAVLWAKYPGGVRGIAHRNNFHLSTWFRHDRAARANANFIAFDFFASTDIVDLCQDINLERAQRRSPNY